MSVYTHELEPTNQFDRFGAIDIETSGLNPTTNSIVAVATGYYDATTAHYEWAVHTRTTATDEPTVIRDAFSWLATHQLDGMITYNGKAFDLPFITHRLNTHGIQDEPSLTAPHVDLYPPRQRAAEQANEKWPALEDCLDAYNIPCHEVTFQEEPLDNTRFGKELAPTYLDAIATNDTPTIQELDPLITAYAGSDIEATIALYEADAGRTYTPSYSFP